MENILNLKPCPFCGSTDLDYSLKVKGRVEIWYHAVIYCKKCRTYGPRTATSKKKYSDYSGREAVENNNEYKMKAAEAWNKRC